MDNYDSHIHTFLTESEKKELQKIKDEHLEILEGYTPKVLRINNIVLIVSNTIFFYLLFWTGFLNEHVVIKYIYFFVNLLITWFVMKINFDYFKMKQTLDELEMALNDKVYFVK